MGPTIVAIGGGSLSESRAEQQIESYILRLTGKDDPRICFIGTASGDSPVTSSGSTASSPPTAAVPAT